MAQIGITQETSTASQPAKVASQTKHQTQPASQPTSQPNKTNQPGNQIQILSEKVMPKTWCSGGNNSNWNYFQRDWTLPCPKRFFFWLAGCNRSLGYRQSRLKRRKETEGPKHQSRSKSSALPLRPERLHSFCVKELGMRHKQQHKPKNTQQKPKTQTKQKHHNNHKREKSHP